MLELNWHQYKYYPYEHQLALREVEKLLVPKSVGTSLTGIVIDEPKHPALADRLVYFASKAGQPDSTDLPTRQAMLERVNGNGPNRQSTRYSAHGLHEYKGKFNPQIAKALLNIFQIKEGDWAFDPFCGSGTSLVEAAHLNVNAVGTDLNPMAVYLANAKVGALGTPAPRILRSTAIVMRKLKSAKSRIKLDDERAEYLSKWFPPETFTDMERLRAAIGHEPEAVESILLAIASNLLRDYSLQEPGDLRIRRRSSPLPGKPLFDAFEVAVDTFARKLADSQQVLGLLNASGGAKILDCRQSLTSALPQGVSGFDVALTSPPYATALPYIDTQRLSLVWLGLLSPSQILSLDAKLVGSREIRGESKVELDRSLFTNAANLPRAEAKLCTDLLNSLTDEDGFRRQAVPRLLYRYFLGMANSFESVHKVMKIGASYGLIVGGNHTILSGKRFDINTPAHLVSLAVSRGWTHVETVELQTYRRYGLHAKNASTTEALVILRA